MNKTFLQLIELVRVVLNGDDIGINKELFKDIQNNDMWKKLYDLAIAQEVQVFLYEGTKNLNLPDVVKKNYYSVYNRAIRKEAIMHIEISRYFEELSKAKIEFLPIKGWLLKDLYPKPYLRSMTDVDVIVRKADFDLSCQIAKKCNFELGEEGINHNLYIKKPVTELEIHHQLFSPKSILYNWGNCVLDKNTELIMDKNDTYIYLIAHMAKHFSYNGIGMRNVIDCYLYNRHNDFSDSDLQYIYSELKKLEIDVFEKRIKELGEIWFEDKKYNSESEMLTMFIMDGGLYGKQGNLAFIELANKSTSKFKIIIKRIFPSYQVLKTTLQYKKMFRIFIPIYWIIYVIKRLQNKENFHLAVDLLLSNEEKLTNAKKVFKYVGIKTTDYAKD